MLKDGDFLIADLIMGLKYEPSHRFKTLEIFEKNMFKVNEGFTPSGIKLLYYTLAPYCGIYGVASKTIGIIYKLTSFEHNRLCNIFKRELLDLDLDTAK